MSNNSPSSREAKRSDDKSVALEKRINREWAVPNRYEGFPEPVIYKSRWGYNRAKCPVRGCEYDGFTNGFNQHYARTHAPEQWRQHSKRVIKAVKTR